MRICVCVNTLSSIAGPVYSNHINFFVKATKTYPDIEWIFYNPVRLSIDHARNTAARIAMENECDYLMFIDDDVMVPDNTLELLINANKDIVAGLVIIRGYPFNVMAFKFKDGNHSSLDYFNDLPTDESGNLIPIIPCDAVGFSCCLIRTDVFLPLHPPYFITGRFNTEDIYFCMKFEDFDPKPTVALHTGVQCGHLLNAEPIEWSNRIKMQEFYKPAAERILSRDEAYLSNCLAALNK